MSICSASHCIGLFASAHALEAAVPHACCSNPTPPLISNLSTLPLQSRCVLGENKRTEFETLCYRQCQRRRLKGQRTLHQCMHGMHLMKLGKQHVCLAHLEHVVNVDNAVQVCITIFMQAALPHPPVLEAPDLRVGYPMLSPVGDKCTHLQRSM